MKLLFDMHLSPRLADRLSILFPGSIHASTVDLGDKNDSDLLYFARREGFTIVTKDADFGDLGLVLGFPPKIVWIRRGKLFDGGSSRLFCARARKESSK